MSMSWIGSITSSTKQESTGNMIRKIQRFFDDDRL